MTRFNTRHMLTLSLATLLLHAAGVATAAAQKGAAPPFPAPGQLVDLGGWRLHLHCTGAARPNQPTVILEAGVGDFSVEWSLVQPRVAAFARVCSYDRAGGGWSELGPRPRTMQQIAFELHTLLQKAGVPAPFVLVGHSYGGLLVRAYTATYPSDVAGLVLVDSGMENGVSFINGSLVRLADQATGRPIPAVKSANPLRESDIPHAALTQIEAAARRFSADANQPPRDKLPADAQRMRTRALAQIKHFAANDNPFESEELAALIAQRRTNAAWLGDRPLIVLTGGLPRHDDVALESERRKMQSELTQLSRCSRHVIAERSGHHIQLDQPELVVHAINDLVKILDGSTRPVGAASCRLTRQ